MGFCAALSPDLDSILRKNLIIIWNIAVLQTVDELYCYLANFRSYDMQHIQPCLVFY